MLFVQAFVTTRKHELNVYSVRKTVPEELQFAIISINGVNVYNANNKAQEGVVSANISKTEVIV